MEERRLLYASGGNQIIGGGYSAYHFDSSVLMANFPKRSKITFGGLNRNLLSCFKSQSDVIQVRASDNNLHNVNTIPYDNGLFGITLSIGSTYIIYGGTNTLEYKDVGYIDAGATDAIIEIETTYEQPTGSNENTWTGWMSVAVNGENIWSVIVQPHIGIGGLFMPLFVYHHKTGSGFTDGYPSSVPVSNDVMYELFSE